MKDMQAHEQIAVGIRGGGLEVKMEAFLDEVEKKIDGKKKVE